MRRSVKHINQIAGMIIKHEVLELVADPLVDRGKASEVSADIEGSGCRGRSSP
jgi:hypothetical protein